MLCRVGLRAVLLHIGGVLTLLPRAAPAPQLSRVQGRTDELRAVSADVERAVRAAADDALEQLRGVEARRQALLTAQAEELCRTLEALDGAAAAAAAACAAAEPPLVFLQRFRALTDTCERLAMKPLREDIEVRTTPPQCPAGQRGSTHPAHHPQVSAEEFEVDARAAVATQAERDKEVLQKLLTVKDQMIWCAAPRPSLHLVTL